MALIKLLILLVASLSSNAVPADDLLEMTKLAPADTRMYVHVHDARTLRHELRGRPIGDWIENVAAQFSYGQLLDGLASASARPTGRLFDTFFARGMTLITRPNGDSNEWVVVTRMSEQRVHAICDRLKPDARFRTRGGLAVKDLREVPVLMLHGDGIVMFAPKGREGLLDEVLRLRTDERRNSLRTHESVAAAAALGEGRMVLIRQHDKPTGGWSSAVIDVDGDDLQLRQRGSYEASPLTRPVADVSISLAALEALEDDFLMAFVEPSKAGASPFESYLEMVTNFRFPSAQLRTRLGDRRIVVIGEQEGRLAADPVDMLQPTLALCYEVDDSVDERVLDREIRGLVRASAMIGVTEIAPPMLEPGTTRHVALSFDARAFGGLHPLVRGSSLHWSLVEAGGTRYAVITSNADHHTRTVEALRAAGEGETARLDHAGTLDGLRVGRHLRSWAEQAEDFADDAEAFADSIELLAGMFDGAERVRWRAKRPTANELEVDVQVTLRPAPTDAP